MLNHLLLVGIVVVLVIVVGVFLLDSDLVQVLKYLEVIIERKEDNKGCGEDRKPEDKVHPLVVIR